MKPLYYMRINKYLKSLNNDDLQAYVQMIRNAENFIYIENQYFLGSAYAWLSDVETNADHTIPAEIAQKVNFHIFLVSSDCFKINIFGCLACNLSATYMYVRVLSYFQLTNLGTQYYQESISRLELILCHSWELKRLHWNSSKNIRRNLNTKKILF